MVAHQIMACPLLVAGKLAHHRLPSHLLAMDGLPCIAIVFLQLCASVLPATKD